MARTQILVKNTDFFTNGLILVIHIIYQLLVMIWKLLHHLKHPTHQSYTTTDAFIINFFINVLPLLSYITLQSYSGSAKYVGWSLRDCILVLQERKVVLATATGHQTQACKDSLQASLLH